MGILFVICCGFNENDVCELVNWMCDVLDVLGKENEE